MALAVANQWTGTGSHDDVSIVVTPSADNWLIVTIAYRCTNGTLPLATIADVARNWWLLCGTASASGGAWKVEVWACPVVRYAPYQLDAVLAAVSHIGGTDVGSVAISVAEVSGFANGFPTATITATTGTATAAGSFSIVMPAPAGSANSFCMAVAAIDDDTKTLSVTSAGWTALTQVSRSGPGLKMAPTWRTSTATQTPAWQISAGTCNWCGIVVALAETGTVWTQPNANWPATKLYLGPTVGQETPLPRVAWNDVTNRFEALRATRGIQYELGRPQAGEVTVTLRDHDDGVTPSPGGTYDIGTPGQLLMAWGGKIYPVASWWAEGFPRRWEDAYHQYLDLDGVDVIAALVQDTASSIEGEILRTQPYAYWRLTDPSGSTNGINVSGRSSALLNLQISKYGAGSGSADFGASTALGQGITSGIAGDPGGTAWQQQGLVSADTDKGYCLVGLDDNFPAISGGITITGVSKIDLGTTQPNVTDLTIAILRNLDPGAGTSLGSVIKLSMKRSDNQIQVTVWDKDTHAATTTATGLFISTGTFLMWAIKFNRTSWSVRYNGSTASGSADLVDNFDEISIGGEADAFWNGRCMNAIHGHVALWDRQLSDGELSRISGGSLAWYAGNEVTSQRLQRLLANGFLNVPRALDTSDVVLGAAGESGPLGQATGDVAAYEDGLVFGGADGYLRFIPRARAYQQSSKWTLGDNTAGGEIPFQSSARPGYDVTYLFNAVVISNKGDSENLTDNAKVATAIDTDKISRYALRQLPRETRLFSTVDAFGLSQWLLALYKSPAHRIAEVTVDAASYPAAWPLVLGAEVGDLVTVVRRSLGKATLTLQCRIVQVSHDIAFGKQKTSGAVTLRLAAAAPAVIVLNDPVKGILNNATIGW